MTNSGWAWSFFLYTAYIIIYLYRILMTDFSFYILLFIFWTMFGSFASVVIHRLKSGEGWILTWRSHCNQCERTLSAIELIPIVSWVLQAGKCKWCKKKVPIIYPLLEITLGLLFLCIWLFLIDASAIMTGNIIEICKLIILLSIAFLTIVYVFYDILYLEIPESILLIANVLVFGTLIFQDIEILRIEMVVISVLTLAGLYTIMLKWLREIYDCLILGGSIALLIGYLYLSGLPYNYSSLISGTIGAVGIFTFFFLQILISRWKWMGWGDLRIAILMGMILGASFAIAWVMLTYLLGSIIGIGMILGSKIYNGWNTCFNSQIPFWPFLAAWYFGVLFFRPWIEEIMKIYL